VIGSAGRDAWPISLAPHTTETLQRLGVGLIVVGFVTAALAWGGQNRVQRRRWNAREES